MTEGQGLELKPLSELGFSSFLAENDILMTDAMHAFAVDCRLVGSEHSRKQRLWIRLETDALRTLMNAKIESYSMTGAVTEVPVGPP